MGVDESVVMESSSPTRESVLTIMKDLVEDLRFSGDAGKDHAALRRYRYAIAKTAPRVNRSVRLMSADVVRWMNRGGPWRTFLILSTGFITSVSLSGIFVFLLFLITATVNTAILALLGSVAAIGAFAALFFTALTGIYIGVLGIAACVISTVVLFTIIAVLSVAGWVAFWWVVWLGAKKFGQFVQESLALTRVTFQQIVSAPPR